MKEKIRIELGDITDVTADAIINAANSELILGGGVAGAINRKGGPKIQAECDKIGSMKVGEAVMTTAGNLKARHVIHAASMSLGGTATCESIKTSVKNSFIKAEEAGDFCVALPAVGAGIAGFPVRRCAEILVDEAKRALMRGKIREVIFVLFDQGAYDAFREAYKALGD